MQIQKYGFKLPVGIVLLLFVLLTVFPGNVMVEAATISSDEADLSIDDLQMLQDARKCAGEVSKALEELVDSNRLTIDQLFDTFYIPIPNTSPQKYHTEYDKLTDEVLIGIIDSCLDLDQRIVFVVPVDLNGYLPTHNSKYSKPLTNNMDYNAKNNRTKRIFNDRTGLTAAKNTKPFLLQTYSRDTGQEMNDLSIPIIIKGKHWGALRVGYSK